MRKIESAVAARSRRPPRCIDAGKIKQAVAAMPGNRDPQ
jgi:hypothetical protein